MWTTENTGNCLDTIISCPFLLLSPHTNYTISAADTLHVTWWRTSCKCRKSWTGQVWNYKNSLNTQSGHKSFFLMTGEQSHGSMAWLRVWRSVWTHGLLRAESGLWKSSQISRTKEKWSLNQISTMPSVRLSKKNETPLAKANSKTLDTRNLKTELKLEIFSTRDLLIPAIFLRL